MIARHIEVNVNPSKYNEFKTVLDREILPLIKRQPGFLGSLSLLSDMNNERAVTITLWRSKGDAENYNKKEFPRILEMIKPFVNGTPTVEYFDVESTTLKTEHTAAA